MKELLCCALAGWSLFFNHPRSAMESQEVQATNYWSYFFHSPWPGLTREEVRVIHYLMERRTVMNGNRILVIGPTRYWLTRLRHEGFLAFGFSVSEMWQLYYGQVQKHSDIPWRSAAFKVVMLIIEADRDILFEVDRLLIPGGFVIIPIPANKNHYDYWSFLTYMQYKSWGQMMKGREIWQKSEERLKKDA